MAAIQIQISANDRLGKAAERFAQLLDCTIIRGASTQQQPSGSTDKFLFFTLPHELQFMALTEPINLICVATMTTKTGWQYLYEKLGFELTGSEKLEDPDHVLELDLCALFRTHNVQFQLQMPRVMMIRLHYCRIHHEQSGSLAAPERIPSSAASNEILLTRLKEARYMATRYMGPNEEEKSALSHDQFRACVTYLASWADCNGITAPDLGLLSTEMIMVLLDNALSEISFSDLEVDNMGKEDLSKLIEICCYPLLLGKGAANNRIQIMSPISGRDLTAEISIDGSRTIKRAIQRSMGPDFVCPINLQQGTNLFLQEFEVYLRVSCVCWEPKKSAQFLRDIKKILVAAQMEIFDSLRGLIGSVIWPHVQGQLSTGATFYFLIGLHVGEQGVKKTPKELKEAGMKLEVNAVAETMVEVELTADWLEDMFDTSAGHVRFEHLSRQEAYKACHVPEQPPLRDTPAEDMPFSWILDERANSLGSPQEGTIFEDSGASSTTSASSNPPTPRGDQSVTRFRTADQCMARLQFDPKHRETYYEIGYTDRFAGMMWKSLESWQKTTEEEDFIPMHRVKQIRRVKDGMVVWDRETKFDGTS